MSHSSESAGKTTADGCSTHLVSAFETRDFGASTIRIGDLNGDGAPDLLLVQSVDETREMIGTAGLVDAVFESKSDYIDQMTNWSDPLYREIAGKLPLDTKPGDFVTTLNVTASRPNAETGV